MDKSATTGYPSGKRRLWQRLAACGCILFLALTFGAWRISSKEGINPAFDVAWTNNLGQLVAAEVARLVTISGPDPMDVNFPPGKAEPSCIVATSAKRWRI